MPFLLSFVAAKLVRKILFLMLIVVKPLFRRIFFCYFASSLGKYILIEMGKKRKEAGGRQGLQAVTLCISTAMVLVLLGLTVFFALMGRNLSAQVKENLVVTVMFEQDMTDNEAQQVCRDLKTNDYVKSITFVSKEQARKETTQLLGTDPTDFVGSDPFLASVDLTLKADYANNDSLKWIAAQLRKYPKVAEIDYQKNLIESVNRNLAKIGFVLLALAVLLTIVSFSLINNTIRLGIFARRFSIHTMKLVGASWGFIRGPFVRQAMLIGVLAALLANLVLAGCMYMLYRSEPQIVSVVTWKELTVTGVSVLLFGLVITAVCANISVNKFLRMKAGDLYKV